ncbi:hypothetical protein Tco_0062306 [Tanacetum coccineum]
MLFPLLILGTSCLLNMIWYLLIRKNIFFSESVTSIPDVTTSEAKTSVSKPKSVGEPLIEDWISESEDENKTEFKSKQNDFKASCIEERILHDLERLDVELCVRGSDGYWASMRIESNLMLQIKEAQRDDGELWAIVQNVEDGKHTEFSVDDDGVVWFEDRLCVLLGIIEND